MPDAPHLFLSYNSRDRDKVSGVHRFLVAHDVPTFLDQQNLRAGQNWPKALEQALRASHAMIVFVGPQVGNWQWPEIGFALDRQANDSQFPVIPVLLDGADTSRSFLFLNTWVDLRGARLNDEEALRRLLEAVSHPIIATEAVDLNPYRGLEIFDEAHAPFFFGRETFIDDLFERVTQQRKKFVAVIGPSGSGKSSVVRAGLIPRLRRQRPPHETWDVAVFTPGERPWFRLADALGALRFPDKDDADLDIEIDKLAKALQAQELSLEFLLDRILQRQGKMHRLLLVVDQFEELFTLTPSQERISFIERLVSSVSVEGLVLVPTLRADFYGQAIEADRRLSDLIGQEQVTLGRLTQDELSRAIIEPARLAHLELDSGLPELLVRDAGNEPGALPLLQHALLELYAQRQGNRLTSAAYRAIGGIRKAIATSAEREFRRFDERGEGAMVRSLFTQLVRLARADEGMEDTRRRIAVGSLPSGARPIVDEFAGYQFRLLVKSSERCAASAGLGSSRETAVREQETVEVAHEALIREWDRLKAWLNEDRGFYLWRQRLDQALGEYEEHGGHADYLLQGPALKEAEGKLASSMPEPLIPRQQDFIQGSVNERDRLARETQAEKDKFQRREHEALARAAQEERRAREAAERSQHAEQGKRQAAERAKRISWTAAAVLLLFSGLILVQYFRAENDRLQATAQTLALRANFLESKQARTRASLLIALSLQIRPTQEAKDAAIAMVFGQELVGQPLRGHEARVFSVAFSADDTRIVSGSWDHTLRLWDAKSGQPIGQPLRGHEDSVFSVAFSADGRRIVSGSGDKMLRLWDAKSGQPIGQPLRGHEDEVFSAAFSGDGTRIVSGSRDKTLRLWDAKSGKPIGQPMRGHEGPVFSVAFSADGTRIVSGSGDNTLRLWDAKSGQPIGEPLRSHEGSVFSVAFSAEGTRIVSGSLDKTLRLWDAKSGQPIGEPLRGHEGAVFSVAFSADGTRIVSGSGDNTQRLWDAKSGQPIGQPLRGHEDSVSSVAFGADGTRIVSGSWDHTLRLWDAKSGKPIGQPLRGHEGPVFSVAFSADGTHIVSGSGDNTLRLWDAKSGQPIGQPLRGHENRVSRVAFSADGTRIVSGSRDETLRLWDAKSGQPVGQPLRGHEGPVFSVAFSADGTRIVSGSGDNTLRLWDAKSGQPIGQPLRGHEDGVFSIAFSADGTRIVSGSLDHTLRFWDAKSGQPIGEPLRGHESSVSSVAYSADGTRIVSGSWDKTLRLWDAKSGKPIGQPLHGHEGPVLSVTFSADGTRIVTGSLDKTLRLWDAKSGNPIGQPLRGHEDSITSVAYSTDGTRIVSGGSDNTLRLWDAKLLDSGDGLQAVLCTTLHRNLSREEWKQYVTEGEAYRAVCKHLPIEE